MKRTVSIILALLLCISLCACGTSSESSSSDTQEEADVYSNAEIESSSEKSHELTDDEVEMIVVQELYNQISTSKWHQADPGSCRYSINKTERKPGFIYIYMVKFIYTINMENLQPDIAMALDLILILLKLNILL